MANPAPTINQINAFNATQGTTIDFNIIGGTELIRSNRIYIYDLSDNSLICTHLYVSTESIHELPANTDGSIVYESGKSSADFVNGAQYYAQIQTYTDTNGTQGGSGLSVAKMFWCLGDPTLTITTIPSTISTTSYNISATYTDTSASVVSNIIQQYQFNLYSATGSLLQSSGVVVGSGTQQGTSDVYDIAHNFTGLNVGSSYYVTVDVTTTQGMSVNAQSNTFTVSIDTPTLGEATVVNNACDGYISVTSNLSGEYGGSGSGEIVSFETDSEDIFTKLQVDLEPIQEGSGTPSPSNVRPIRGHSGVDVNVVGKNLWGKYTTVKNSYADGGDFKTTSSDNFVDNGDGTYTINESTSGAYGVGYKVDTEIGITYTVSCKIYSPSKNMYVRVFKLGQHEPFKQVFLKGDGVKASLTFVAESELTLVGFIGLETGNKVGDVMVEFGTTATEYEPYNPNSTTVSQDFNVSLTPTSTDTTPYLFKAVGDVYGDRLEDKIVGGTVAWNQLADNDQPPTSRNGVTFEQHGDYFTMNGTATGALSAIGWFNLTNEVSERLNRHKVLVDFQLIDGTVSDTTSVQFHVNGHSTSRVTLRTLKVIQCDASTDHSTLIVSSGTIFTNVKARLQVFDLTQMFGSTIADYIYSLEQSQAGAGVAWFKKLFPKDYYAYNAGEPLSVEGLQSHDTVGFNQWDEEWEILDGHLRTKNYNPCIGGANYFLKGPTISPQLFANGFGWYDANKELIETNYYYNNIIVTAPTNARYFRFDLGANYGTTYNHDICINLSNPSRNGEYEPYEKHSYPLDSSLTLRGIPKLDASNNLYYDGDEYTSDGKVKRKYGVVVLNGSEPSWLKSGVALNGFYIPMHSGSWLSGGYMKSYTPVIALGYTYTSDASTYQNNYGYAFTDHTIAFNIDPAICGSTVEEFKTWLASHPITVVYELATPTTETAQAYTNPQIVSKYGTLEYVTNSIVPVGHKTTYLTRDIFGGYVDLISGKLVVDRAMVVFDGTQSDFGVDALSGFTQVSWSGYISIGIASAEFVSDTFEFDKTTAGVGKIYASPTAPRMFFGMPTSITSPSEAQEWFRQHPTSVVYPLATPQTYQLTPQQVNTLVGTNNVWSEQGNIELSYHIPITNLLVKRQDVDDVSGGWLTLYSQPISQASDMDFTFIDFLNQYGKTYKYALVPLLTQTQSGVEVEVEGGYTVSNEVQSIFDGVFIADSTGSQKCKANVGYGNVDMNQVVGSITPIGAKYPIIITNSHNQYHNGSISGTIVPDDYYFNGNLSRIDMVNKRNELEQFLTNKRVKVIKDWNGNIWLVMIVGNVSCTFNNNYGMGIVSFSTNWTEVGDPTNQQDLQATGLINVGGV